MEPSRRDEQHLAFFLNHVSVLKARQIQIAEVRGQGFVLLPQFLLLAWRKLFGVKFQSVACYFLKRIASYKYEGNNAWLKSRFESNFEYIR